MHHSNFDSNAGKPSILNFFAPKDTSRTNCESNRERASAAAHSNASKKEFIEILSDDDDAIFDELPPTPPSASQGTSATGSAPQVRVYDEQTNLHFK